MLSKVRSFHTKHSFCLSPSPPFGFRLNYYNHPDSTTILPSFTIQINTFHRTQTLTPQFQEISVKNQSFPLPDAPTTDDPSNPSKIESKKAMFGAVQLGVIAACVVLFVPMGLAGWHLSRNKVLFFSGALFITLAVGVHLIPYFPSFTTSPLPSLYKDSIFPDPSSCIPLLHEIVFDLDSSSGGEINWGNSSNVLDFDGYWKWDDSRIVVSECGFSRLGRVDASELLNGSWVVVAGDSQARLFVVSLLSLVLGDKEMELVKGDLFKRHSDYEIVVSEIGLRLDFVWAPYVANLTDVMIEFRRNKTAPDVLVMGAGLWDMLHVSSSLNYGVSLGLLRDSLVSLLPVSADLGTDGPVLGSDSVRSPHLFWLGMPTLVNTMLNTEEKREKMTSVLCDAYDKELFRSKLLRQYGGPLLLLDIRSLSKKCGTRCTMDGMHYSGVVYESSVHIMLNALLIESHQKL